VEADRGRTDKDGVTLEAALAQCGIDVERVGLAVKEQKNLAAYLELHIEQGPILERLGKALAVVEGTKGVERWAITFRGRKLIRLHADGSTAGCVGCCGQAGAGDSADCKEASAGRRDDGKRDDVSGDVTAVVGRCETTLDMRDLDAQVLARMLREARDASERFAKKKAARWSGRRSGD